MKIVKFLLFSAIIVTNLFSQNLIYSNGEILKAGGGNVNNPFGTPAVADWDDDGVFDLLVGEMVRAGPYDYLTGKLMFYKNSGSNTTPNLDAPKYVQVNGSDIELEAG